MRVVLQRVRRASVAVNGDVIAAIGRGLALLVGIGPGD
ncbi:MAG: D-tyrosyl-tRNA(Tyr) deacylase, partial [Chloroflexi bacterium]|nr:D-tyrosyl-tRNA(Tyr) deacylase [Chloroflexota bacterium]